MIFLKLVFKMVLTASSITSSSTVKNFDKSFIKLSYPPAVLIRSIKKSKGLADAFMDKNESVVNKFGYFSKIVCAADMDANAIIRTSETAKACLQDRRN